MATRALNLYCDINEDGDAQNPTGTGKGVWMMLTNPDRSEHTAWTEATQDTDVGDGAFYVEFTIDDESDVAGVYTAHFKAVTDADKAPIGSYPVTVRL